MKFFFTGFDLMMAKDRP